MKRGSDSPPPPPGHQPDERERRTTYAEDPDKRFRFEPDRRARFILHLRAGASIDTACDRIGCSPNTPRDWDRDGQAARLKELRGEPLNEREAAQLSFSDEYRSAIAEVKTRLVGQIVSQSQKDWRAAMALLGVRWPAEYSERFIATKATIDANAEIRAAELQGVQLDNATKAEKLEAIREARQNGGKLMVIDGEDVLGILTESPKLALAIAAFLTNAFGVAVEDPDDFVARFRPIMLEVLQAEGFRFVVERDLRTPGAA